MREAITKGGAPKIRVLGFKAHHPIPVTKLYQGAGINNGSRIQGRCTFVSKVMTASSDMETVAQLHEHTSINCSQRYVDVGEGALCGMFANAV